MKENFTIMLFYTYSMFLLKIWSFPAIPWDPGNPLTEFEETASKLRNTITSRFFLVTFALDNKTNKTKSNFAWNIILTMVNQASIK